MCHCKDKGLLSISGDLEGSTFSVVMLAQVICTQRQSLQESRKEEGKGGEMEHAKGRVF